MRSRIGLAIVVFASACASSTAQDNIDAAPPCVPTNETCNDVDDDCDMKVDEGYTGVGEPCEAGVGSCHATGKIECAPNGHSTRCNAVATTPAVELCDTDADEDCDGKTDEGFAQLNMPCSSGTGACAVSGVYVCSPDGAATRCGAVAGNGTPETCNSADDDCDGNTDEGFAVNTACDGTSDTDLCTEGVWICNGSGGRTCTDNTASTTDLCGNGDEDCDSSSVDGAEDPMVTQSCDGPDSDACIEGVWVCTAGALACSDTTSGTTELCNGSGADEDCDGSADENWVRNDNPVCASTVFHLGSLSGDTGAGTLTDSWYAEAWSSVRLIEDSTSSVYLSSSVRLYSPPGTDYDLYLYCANCPGAAAVQSSTTSGVNGHYDFVYPRWDDDFGEVDDYDIILEVRHKSSTLCAYWTLDIVGNTDLTGRPNTCDP